MSAPTLITRPAAMGIVDARETLRRHGRSFHFASHLLGARHAANAARLYAFCRHVDDLADDGSDAGAARAALAEVAAALRSGRSNDPRVRDMLMLQTETGMSPAPAQLLVEGLTGDLDAVCCVDEPALIDYAYRVAGTVGLMMCAALDVSDARAGPFAIELGIAMQLTNIARDVGDDARLGRRYLPGPWVEHATPDQIAAPDPALQRKLRSATHKLLSLAERYYRSAEQGMGYLPLGARLAILTASRVYRAIGARIAAHGYRSWDRRAVVGTAGKLIHAGGALAGFVFAPHVHRRGALHRPELHAEIRGWVAPMAKPSDVQA